MCEAIAGLFKSTNSNSFFVSVAWAQNRPSPNDAPPRTVITNDVVPTIEEAARIFRARDTLESYEVRGPVVKLERSEGHQDGRATVYAKVDEVMRKVVVHLSAMDYDKATRAHREFRSVRIVGDVVKDGRSFRLENSGRLDFSNDDDDAS
jgi:hypothetical protein